MSSSVVYRVVDLPEPVGPTMTMPPSGALSAASKRARLSPTSPSDASVGGSGETSRMRMVRFSPYMLGMEARRRSTASPLDSSKLVRPSCGSRRSAMLRLPMILRRLMMPACSSLGNSRISWSTPSMRQRTLQRVLRAARGGCRTRPCSRRR